MEDKTLIVVAHPDDETLWFSSVILRKPCDVVVVTCGNNKATRQRRRNELRRAADLLGIKNLTILNHPDVFGSRLDITRLESDLRKIAKRGYNAVYTHGPFGDTNEHFHHQDVSYIVHNVFRNVQCTAWNILPDSVNTLTPEEYSLKKYIMGTTYSLEYRKLKTTYEVSSVEKFVSLTREAVEIFYWSIANFGDRHERLGRRYQNIWGYDLSPYEIERHAVILSLVKQSGAQVLLEIGASEGSLTQKLAPEVQTIHCVETAPSYRKKLAKKGFILPKKYESIEYDIVVIASVLEYMEDPVGFLSNIESTYILIDVIDTTYMKQVARSVGKRYKLIEEAYIPSRWERMYHDNVKEKMEVYKLGARVYLYCRKQ